MDTWIDTAAGRARCLDSMAWWEDTVFAGRHAWIWLASLAMFLPPPPGVAGPVTPERPTSTGTADAKGPSDIILDHYVVILERDGAGHWHLSLATHGAPPEYHYCHPDAPRSRNELAFTAALECENVLSSFHEAATSAVARVERAMSTVLENLGDDPSREEIVAVQHDAELRFREVLARSGSMHRALRAWEIHALRRSSCFREKVAEYRARIARRARETGTRCDDWSAYLRLCTADGQGVSDHVKLMSGLAPPDEVRRAILVLLESGLAECLGRIIEEDDPVLARTVSQLRPNREHPPTSAVNDRAWKLWRRRGVDRWYEIVRKEGKVPEKLRLEILQCAGGHLPPVVETADEPPSPSSRPVR